MGHVEMRAHHRFPRDSLGSQACCPCSLPPPAIVPTGLHWGWLAQGGCRPGEAAGPCALVGCRGGYRTGPVMPPLWGNRLLEMCCWQHEVSEAGLGSSQGPAVSRYP